VVKEHWGASGLANTDLDHEVNGPAFAHAVLTTREVIAALARSR
jgi:hypothetical protein